MISITNIDDIHGRKLIKIDQEAADGKGRMTLSLTTSDIPSGFERFAQPVAELSIVSKLTADDDASAVLFMPVEIRSIARLGGLTKIYYRQAFDRDNSSLPQLDLTGYIIQKEHSAVDLKATYFVRIAFDLEASQANQDKLQPQQTTQNLSQQELDQLQLTRRHIDAGENSNGGRDLPVEVQEIRRVEQEHRENV